MDIEQLKLVLEAVKGVTSGAVWVAVLYFILPLAKTVVICIAWVFVLKYAINPLKLWITSWFKKPTLEEKKAENEVEILSNHLYTAFLEMLNHKQGYVYSHQLNKEHKEEVDKMVLLFKNHVPGNK